MKHIKLLPRYLALIAALITLIGGLYNRLTITLFLIRSSFSILIFYLLGALIVKYVLTEKKGHSIDVRIEDNEMIKENKETVETPEETDGFEELEPPVISNMDEETEVKIRGGRL